MARPKTPEAKRRSRQISIGLTTREHALLHARSASLGLRPVDYARARLFGGKVGTDAAHHAPHLDPLLLAQLSRVGNNLNQIARRMHAFDQPAPPSLDALLQQVRALINRGAGDGS